MAGDVQSRMAVFLFTDIVDSTAIQNRLGTDAYLRLLARHDALYREAVVSAHGGRIVEKTGDGFLTELASPSDAVNAALHFQALLRREEWRGETLRARCGIHAGELTGLADSDGNGTRHGGMAINFAARLMDLGQGGQILLSRAVFDDARRNVRAHPPGDPSLEGKPLRWEAHGRYLFKGADEPSDVFEVGTEGLSPLSPPPDGNKAKRYLDAEEAQTLGWRPAVGLEIPRREDWELQDKIGQGGFGEVWLARHRRLKESRVFKFCFDAERLRSFRREVTLFRLLRDTLGDRPDIARLHDVQVEKPPFFLESEYCPEGNLADWAQRQGGIEAVPMATRLALLERTCRAVAAAHSVGIIHKDIKPANLLIVVDEGEPRPRLADFGIGVLADRIRLEQHAITAAGFTATLANIGDASRTGTRLYAAPEYLAGGAATTLGDIYALGVVLYQLTVGDLGRPLGPGWERDVSDPLLREDIAAAVDGDPSRRLASALELADRIATLGERRLEKQRAADAEARATADRTRHSRRRLQLRVALVGVVLLAAAAGLLTRGYRIERHQRQDAEAAEALARSLVYDMRDALDRLGDQKVARDFNQRIVDYYDRLGPGKLGKEPLRQYVAALHQLGDSLLSLGDLAAAGKSYGRALAMLVARRKERPDDVFRGDLIVAFTKVAEVAQTSGDIAGALTNLTQSLELARDVARDHPDRPDALRLSAVALERLGKLEVVRNNLDGAIRYQTEALQVSRDIAAKTPDRPAQQIDVAEDEALLARHLSRKGDNAGALRLGRSSLETRRRLAAQRPDDASALAGLLYALDTLVGLQVAAEQFAEADPTAAEELRLAERLAGRDPNNLAWQQRLGIANHIAAKIAMGLKNLPVARRHAEKALEIAIATAARDPGRFEWQRGVASSHGVLSTIQSMQGELAAAIGSRELGLTVLRQLAASNTESFELQSPVAGAAAELAALHGKRGKEGEADVQKARRLEQEALGKLRSAKRLLPGQAARLQELDATLRPPTRTRAGS